MALQLITNFIAGNDGETALFSDITGATASTAYGRNGNITYSDVDAIRLKIATLSSIENVETISATEAFTPYVEYICTLGSGTIDGKEISVGDYFVPNTTSLVVPSGMEFNTTGNYVYPWLATWLPTSSQVPLTISLSEMNQALNSTMEDSCYTLDYEVYIDQFSITTAAVSGQQYIVKSGTCTYNGSTYRAGDIFIAVGTTNIAIVSGVVAKLDALVTQYFVVTYNMIRDIFEILPTASAQTQQEIYDIRVQLEALSFSSQTGNVSYTYTQGLLDKLQNQVTYLLNNN